MGMTIESLRQRGASEYRQVPTGNFTQNRNGRRVAVTKGVEFVRTESGLMEIDEWMKQMLLAVESEGQKDLLMKIIEHCSSLPWLKTEDNITLYALECLSSEAYKHWKGFGL